MYLQLLVGYHSITNVIITHVHCLLNDGGTVDSRALKYYTFFSTNLLYIYYLTY